MSSATVSAPGKAVLKGARVVESATDFDFSVDALKRVFDPVSLPEGFRVGTPLLDRFTGHRVRVVGVAPLREKSEVLYLRREGVGGATPFLPGEAFFARWQILEESHISSLLQEGALFDFTRLEGLNPKKLHLTPLLAPVPVDVTQLFLIGLESGCILQPSFSSPTGVRQNQAGLLRVLGLRPNPADPEGSVTLLLQDTESDKLIDLTSTPPQDGQLGLMVAKVPDPLGFRAVVSNCQTVTYNPKPVQPDHPLQLTEQYRIDQVSLDLFDTDPTRCSLYFGVEPGQIVNETFIVIGLRYVAAIERKEVELCVLKLDDMDVSALEKGSLLHIFQRRLPKRASIPYRRRSLLHPAPLKFSRPCRVPSCPQSKSSYNMTFPYMHRGRQRMLFDDEAGWELAGFKKGQRFQDEQFRFSTFIGMAQDTDGKFEYMFEVDGAPGAGAYTEGTKLRMFEDVVQVQPLRTLAFVYSPQEVRPFFPTPSDAFYKLGKVAAAYNDICTNTNTLLQLFGVRVGQRLGGFLTVIGCKVIKDKLHLLFHEDGHDGATIFSDSTSFPRELDENGAPITTEVVFGKGRAMKYEFADLVEEFPVQRKALYSASNNTSANIKMSVDDSERVCVHYFNVKPGQRIDGNSTFVGVTLADGKVKMAGLVDGHTGVGLYTAGQTILVEETFIAIDQLPVARELPESSHTVVYRRVPVDPADPPNPTFPVLLGIQEPYPYLLDVDPNRMRKYFGVVPGQRVNGNSTTMGMKVEQKTGLVECFFHVDGSKGAGVYTDEATLTLDPIIKRLTPAKVKYPLPRGTKVVEVEVPKLSQDASVYKFTVPYITNAGKKILFDIEYLEKTFGWKHGERFGINDGPFSTLIGVGQTEEGDTNGQLQCWWQMDTAVGPGIYTVGTKLYRYPDDIIIIPPITASRTVIYQKQTQRADNRIKPETPAPLGIRDAKMELVDTDPARCKAYFDIVPGARIDRRATAVGMRLDNVGMVEMWFQLDKFPGAGVYTDGTVLEVEDPQEPSMEMVRSASNLFLRADSEATAAAMTDFTPSRECDDEAIPYLEAAAFKTLTDVAGQALNAVGAAALDADPEARRAVIARIQAAGFEDPEETLTHIAHFLNHQVPIISWFKPFKMVEGKPVIEWMTEDIYMRNLFEIGTGNGSQNLEAREQWESRIFRHTYDKAQPSQRVKYGLLNIFNDPKGPATPGDQYGDCYLVLSGVRDRTSVTPMDSCDRGCAVGLLNGAGISTVLVEFQETGDELEKLAKIAHGRQAFFSSAASYYKEAQIHGSVMFERHVSHIVIHPKYLDQPANLLMLYTFCMKNACWLVTTETLQHLAEKRLWSAKKMLEYISEHRIEAFAHTAPISEPPIALVCSPQTAAQRKYYNYIVRHHCMEEMHKIQKLLVAANLSEWSDPNKAAGSPRRGDKGKTSPTPAPVPAEAGIPGLDGLEPERLAALRQALGGAGAPSCKTS